MELKEVVLPLIIESRKRFGSNSLLLMIDSVKICNQLIDPKLNRTLLSGSAAGLNILELFEVSSGNNVIQGYIGEIRHWQTKPCKNLNEILISMFKIDNLDIIPLKSLQDISVWKEKNDELGKAGEFTTVLCFTFIDDNEYFVSDDEILTFLHYSLQTHFGSILQISMEEIKQIALPVIIFRQLWIVVTESQFIKINIKLYDFDGFECGYIKRISFCSTFSESVSNFRKELSKNTEYKAHEMTRENLRKDDCKLNELYPHQEIQNLTETDISDTFTSHDQSIVHVSKSAIDEENKLWIINKIRKAVEMIVEVSSDDNQTSFISLGFDSLKLARLEFILQSEFFGKFSISYGSTHQHSNIDTLSEYILKNSLQKNAEIIDFQFLTEKLTKLVRNSIEIPLSAAQKRLIFLRQLDPERKLSFIETLKFEMESLKVHQFKNAFNRVIARHTALRTIYTITGQTVLSLTEAYFSICIKSDYAFSLSKSIDLFDPSVPMRIFVIKQGDSRDDRKLKKKTPNRINQEENQWIQEKKQTMSTEVMKVKSNKSANKSNLIIIQMHHIMIDGFSIKLLTDELRVLYYEKNLLKKANYQYGHFVLLEEQRRQNFEERKLRENFWQYLLHNVVLHMLPADETKSQLGRYSGCYLEFNLDSRIYKCLQNLAIWCCVTPFSVLIASFQLLLYKRCGFKDSCIGIVVAQREISELCTIVGCLLNVIPLINTIDPDDQIHDFIRKSCKRLNESIQKQLQFDDLIAAIHLERDLSNSPLFQVLFILDDNSDISDTNHHNMRQNNEYFQNHDSNFAQYDQVWYFQCYKEGITVKIEYNGSRFYKNTIETMVHQYFRLLYKMWQNLHMCIQDIKMISSMEEFVNYQLRIENRCDFPQKCTILDLIDKQNTINPYSNTVIQNGIAYSSIFLQRKSNQLSRFLTQSWLQFCGENMQNDNFVLIIFDRSIHLLLSIFALWKCGIGVAPLNLETLSKQLDEILEKFTSPAIIYENKEKQHNVSNQCVVEDISKNCYDDTLQNSTSEIMKKQKPIFKHDMKKIITLISEYSDQEIRKKLIQHNLAYMTFTSGSTGTPKGICTEFYGFNNLVLNYAEKLSIKSSSTIYQVVNSSFDIFFADILESQANGANLCLANQRIPDLDEMSKVTHAYIMPAYLSTIQSDEFIKLINLEQINFGGDYISYKVLQNAIQNGLHFHHQYGMTEHSIYSSCKLMKICDKISSIGKSFKNIHFSIHDNDKNLCGQHIIGICYTSGPGISRGYYDNENLNQLSFLINHNLIQLELLLNYDKRYFCTGDLAEIKNNIGELFFHGRNDFQVKIRGMQVNILTIEAILAQHHFVKECIVCLQRTEIEELLIAYIISFNDFMIVKEQRQLIIKNLNEYMLKKVPIFMIPNDYVFVQEFPLNINGKIDRKLLSITEKLPNSKNSLKIDYIFEPWEKKIMEVFAALLPGKTIQLEDSFFEMGGDSLKALIAIQNIKRETGLNLQLQDIFGLTSFRAILERLKENSSRDKHRITEDPKKLKLEKFKSNLLQIHSNSDKLTNDRLISIDNMLTKDSDNFMDKDKTISRRMSWKSEKIYNDDKQKSRFWSDLSIPISLQQERLLFLYSFGKEYRESYKLQFLIVFHDHINLKVLNITLNYMMRKHRLLRTIFSQKAGKTFQELLSLSECYIEVHKNMLRYDELESRITTKLSDLYDMPLLTITVSNKLELLLILDHLIVDGRSIAILSNDLVEFYNKLISGDSVSSDINESYSYAEFCLKQRSQLEKFRIVLKNNDSHLSVKDELQLQEECQNLKEMIQKLQNFPPLSLHGDLSNDDSNRRNNIIKFKMPLDLSTIKNFCMTERCTLFTYLLCIFSLTIHSIQANQHHQQKHRFAIVSSALNRTSDTINCVGLFVNNIIIPIDITFQDISKIICNLQQNIVNALQFQHIPFDYIIQKLNPKRSSKSIETYPISFVVQNASAIKLPKIDGVETVTEEIGAKYAKFDQAWYCTEFEDYIEILMEYRIAKYSDLKIKHTMELFTQIASHVLSNRFAKMQDILKYSKFVNVEKSLNYNDKQENMIEIQDAIKKNWMLEKSLLDIWKEVLGSSEITIFDNFFARGGHSLLIPNICYKIEQKINYQCLPQAIFEHQTIRELAEYINSKQNSKLLITSKISKIHVCPLQESLLKMYYNLAETSISSIATTTVSTTTTLTADRIKAYQTGFSISLKSINLLKLRYSLNLIIMCHSSLRTTFYRQNNNFYQEIHSGTENYIVPQKITSKQASLIVPNPFHTIPILCWLNDDIKKELADNDNHCELHFKISHIICDGKSLSIIAEELYQNYFKGIHISIKNEDFIQFSKRTEQRFRERNTEMKRFWSKTLIDAESMNLHYQKIIDVTTSSSNRCKWLCKNFKNLHIFIKRIAKKCCCTPFVVQLAAFSKVLSEMATTQSSKVVISCPIDMRDSEAQQCVGMCINVLPVVINLKHKNFQDLIQNVAKSLADAYVNADISIEELEKLCEKQEISNFADIMIVNNYEEYSDGYYQILNDNSEFTKCLLTLFLMQHQDDIIAKIEFKQHLFYNESIHIMLNQWAKIIRRMEMFIVTNDEMKYNEKQKCLYDIPCNEEYYSAEKRKELNMESEGKIISNETEKCFVERNQDGRILQKCDYPIFSYQHLLRECFTADARLATMIALIANKESINYHTLSRLIHQTSKIIREKVTQITGSILRADTVIPVIARNNIKTLITCLAVIMAGAAYLPIDSTSPRKRIVNILKQMETKFYITVDVVMNNNEEFQKSPNFSFQNITEINLNNIKLGEESLESPVNLRNTPNDLIYVIFTSGTTGKPKGVAIGQHGLLNMAIACTRDFWMNPDDCVYQFTNFAFDNSVLEIMMALINGSTLLLREDFFMPRKFLNEMKHARITHALLFPGLVNTFTDDEIEELQHLRYWIVGAESVGKRVLEHALKSGINVIQNYGPTETTAYALTKRMKLLDKPNNIGRGIINAITVVRNFCGEVVPKTGVGELCIEGVGIMRGYIVSSTDDEADDNSDRENENKKYDVRKHETSEITVCREVSLRFSFNTKDIVRLQPNNDILFLGRYDKQIKIRGYRVELDEIEAILCQYPQIISAKVIPKLINGQQQLVAFIISSDLSNIKFHSSTMRKFMLEHLPYYMVPIEYHFLQQYPLTKNSKIDIAALEMLPNPKNDQYFKHVEPENSIESKLLGLFRKVLQDDNISMNDDFFAVGGNSFSAAQLTELIEANITYCFSINNIFHYRTVRKLSQYILDSSKKPNNERIIQNFYGIQKKNFKIDNIPLSFQQQQFRFLNETKQREYYELIFVQNFDTSLSLRHLKLAFLRLILRQSSFRTIFPEQNYDMYQEILSGTEAYFDSNNLQNSYFPMELDCYNDDRIAKKIKILKNERVNFKHKPPVLCAIEAINNTSYTVILRMNHIISDAWSTNLLENDLRDLYQEVLKTGKFNSNSKLSFTYAEYSIDQFEKKHLLEKLAARYADKIVKWLINDQNYNKISDNWERIENQVNQFGWINQNLNSEIFNETDQYMKSTDFGNYSEIKFNFEVKEIEKICGYFEITPFVAFLSAFASSLHELSDTRQLIINVPVANRSLKTDCIIGNFLNYLLICSTHIISEEVDNISDNATNTTSRNTIDCPINSIKFDIPNHQTEGRFPHVIYSRVMKKYLDNINTAVNEVRQFEQVPFIELLKLIRTKLKKLKPLGIEMLDRLHKTIFFNFRYGLEENHESTLGKSGTQEPEDCIHEIEVEIDRVKSYYSCKIRMKNHRNSRKHILALCQWMIFSLKQMSINSRMQEISNDEIKPKENKHETTLKQSSFFMNSDGGNAIELELKKIWSECLKKRRIRDDDDFFLEGGTSLLTLKLRHLIESELKIHIEIDEIFKYSTFIQLSNLLQKRFVNKDFHPDKRIELLNPEFEKNNDPISQSDKKTFGKRDTVEERKNLQILSRNRSTIRLFHQRESNINIKGNTVIVFFHALVGGVTWTYASLIRQLIRKLQGPFKIIGVEHPDSFSGRCPRNPKFYHSIESLCFQYVQDLDDHLRNVKIRIFIGASFGAILAYQCALQLQREGIHIDDIISIDGTSQWCRNISSTKLSSYEEHCQQINKIVKYRIGDMKIDSEILEAMIENAWELLKMMRIYVPSRRSESLSRLHVTLLKSSSQKTLADNDDYGWMNLCSRTIINIPFSHDTMLDDCNIDTIIDIIILTITKVKDNNNYS